MKPIVSLSKVYGTNAERLAMNLAADDKEIQFYETDTNIEYLWKGSEWIVQDPPAMTLIPVVENTWIDISDYVGKLIHFTASGADAYVEFSNDGVNAISSIQKMNLNPVTWSTTGGGANEWSTNYPANYIRFPLLSPFVGSTVSLYGAFSPIERKALSIVSEASFGSLASGASVIGEELAHDPFVQRVTVDADPNGVQALVQVEYSGKRTAGNTWVMHSPPVFLGTGGTLAFLDVTPAAADNEVILAPSQKICTYFNQVAIYCTAGTVDVEIRSRQFGTWNTATLRRQSDNVLVTQLAVGEVGILENVAFENLQVLQKGAIASNADVIFADPFKESVPFVDLGAYGGAVAVTSYSSAAAATIYLHKYY